MPGLSLSSDPKFFHVVTLQVGPSRWFRLVPNLKVHAAGLSFPSQSTLGTSCHKPRRTLLHAAGTLLGRRGSAGSGGSEDLVTLRLPPQAGVAETVRAFVEGV